MRKNAQPPVYILASCAALLLLVLAGCSGGEVKDIQTPVSTLAVQVTAAPTIVELPSTGNSTPTTPAEAPVSTPTAAEEAAPTQTLATQMEKASPQTPVSGGAAAEIACTAPADPTPPMTEGPYFKAGSPERTSLLEPGMTGTRLLLSGYVLTVDCQPIASAVLDFWQADDQGQYDNAGYRLRGHLTTNQNGFYQLETIIPGLYPGRTEHIHVKVQAPGVPVITTQLYFPDVSANETDRIFSPQLLVNMQDNGSGKLAAFNFILPR